MPALLALPYAVEVLIVLTGMAAFTIQQNGPRIASSIEAGLNAAADGINNLAQQISTMSATKAEACQSCEDEKARCKEVRAKCRETCSETSLPTRDYGVKFWRCFNTCTEDQGC